MTTDSELKMAKNELTAGIAVGAVSGATIGLLIGTIWGLSAIVLPGAGAVLAPANVITLLTSIALSTGIGAAVGGLLLIGLIKLGFYAQEVEHNMSRNS